MTYLSPRGPRDVIDLVTYYAPSIFLDGSHRLTHNLGMGWIEQANNFGQDYHGLFGAVGGTASFVSLGFSVVGYFQDRSERRKMLGQLAAIRDYVERIDGKVNTLLEQQQSVLQALDELPEKFRRIALQAGLEIQVEKTYSELRGLRATFYQLGGTRFQLSEGFWRDVAMKLTYAYEQENRPSRNSTLASFGEFAIAVTGGAATSFVRDLVADRIVRLGELHALVERDAGTVIARLRGLLDHPAYVSDHNYDKASWGGLSVGYAPDATRSATRHRDECSRQYVPEQCRWDNVCRKVPYTVQVADDDFNGRRDAHRAEVERETNSAKVALQNVALSAWARGMFADYLKVLEQPLEESSTDPDGAFSLVRGAAETAAAETQITVVRCVADLEPDERGLGIIPEKKLCND